MAEYLISKEDQEIRKKWLWLTISANTIFLILSIITHFLFKEWEEMGVELFMLLFELIPIYLMYRWAYKKPGTKFLTFNIVTGILIGPISLIYFLFDLRWELKLNFLISLPVYYMWLHYSYLLRKTNRKIRQERLQLNPEYVNGIKLLQESKNAADLKIRFLQLVRENPAIKFEIKKDFKKLKKSFAKA